ncbi:MAG TPA: hypothetical protein VFP61_14380 [Acidimicrobiales bacterium]|nr:hypothetical protein [Acidimicrobiales bacterium]
MRTTVTLDADTEAMVRRRMRERGESFKQALNGAIRDSVQRRPAPDFPTAKMGVPAVNLDRALQLAAELEDDEVVRKMRTGR